MVRRAHYHNIKTFSLVNNRNISENSKYKYIYFNIENKESQKNVSNIPDINTNNVKIKKGFLSIINE